MGENVGGPKVLGERVRWIALTVDLDHLEALGIDSLLDPQLLDMKVSDLAQPPRRKMPIAADASL